MIALFEIDEDGEATGHVYHFCGDSCAVNFRLTIKDRKFNSGDCACEAIPGTQCDSCGLTISQTVTTNERPIVVRTLTACLQLFDDGHALSRFDWGKSFLRAEDIRELNELPGTIREALKVLGES